MNTKNSYFRKSIFQRCIKNFSSKNQLKIYLTFSFQALVSFLDLAGVLLIGVMSGLLIYRDSMFEKNSRIYKFIDFTGLSNYEPKRQLLILGLVAFGFFALKTFISIFLIRRMQQFFFKMSADISNTIVKKIFALPISKLHDYTIQNTNYISSTGASNIAILLSNYANLFCDTFLCVLLLLGLSFTNLQMTLFIVVLFGSSISILYIYFRNRSKNYGMVRTKTNIRANELFYEGLNGFREIIVSGRSGIYINKINEKITNSALNESRIAFVPYLNKYIVELLLIVAIFFVGIIQFSTASLAHAITVLTIFLAASTRIVPAMLRIQQSTIAIRNSIGITEDTLKFLELLQEIPEYKLQIPLFTTERKDFIPEIEIENLEFQYSDQSTFNLQISSLKINPLDKIGIVGKSGAGKSSFIDLMLGLNIPKKGSIKISGIHPREAFEKWPGGISYVPQTFHTINGTLKENICMGLQIGSVPDSEAIKVLELAQLGEFVKYLPQGLETWVGDKGAKLSGGQRQRLSIARALITKPNILILDEATSSLDIETEKALTDLLDNLDWQITFIVIAHRLSTIKHLSKLIYLEDGRIQGFDTFNNLKKTNVNFARQLDMSNL